MNHFSFVKFVVIVSDIEGNVVERHIFRDCFLGSNLLTAVEIYDILTFERVCHFPEAIFPILKISLSY